MQSNLRLALWAAYLVFWVGGIGGHVLYGGTPAHMAWAAPLFLLLAAAIAIASTPSWWKSMAAAAGIGFVAEVIGVRTGLPFGVYHYTGVLAPSIAGVPLVLAGAWLTLFTYVSQMRVNAVASAAWMAAIDLVIDPLAANDLSYWKWAPGGAYYGVPAINFAGWFLVSLLIFLVTRSRSPRSTPVVLLGTTIIVFFAAVAASHHYLFPAAFGLALAAFGWWRSRRVYSAGMS